MTFSCKDLKPGDVCITRGGKEVVYMGENAYTSNPHYRYIFASDVGPHSVGDNGRLHSQCPLSSMDIIRKKPQKRVLEGWVNVYYNDMFTIWATKEEADSRAASQERIACVHIRQEYEEGEGL